jgi:hypothetical protein
MTAPASGALDVPFVTEMIFQMLDSIRYSRDVFNPLYVALEANQKLKTTRQLRTIAKTAACFFCAETVKHPEKYVNNEQATKALMTDAIHHALSRREAR